MRITPPWIPNKAHSHSLAKNYRPSNYKPWSRVYLDKLNIAYPKWWRPTKPNTNNLQIQRPQHFWRHSALVSDGPDSSSPTRLKKRITPAQRRTTWKVRHAHNSILCVAKYCGTPVQWLKDSGFMKLIVDSKRWGSLEVVWCIGVFRAFINPSIEVVWDERIDWYCFMGNRIRTTVTTKLPKGQFPMNQPYK